MNKLSVQNVLLIHEKLVLATGGASGLRDMGLLESAVMSCYHTFGGEMLYPSAVEKAAQIAFAISRNHPFVDGNKRVAVTAMLALLRQNKVDISFTQEALIALGLGLADGSLSYEDVVAWIKKHMEIS